jgi:hypothetical protein
MLGIVHLDVSVDVHIGWKPGFNLPTIGIGLTGGCHLGLGLGVSAGGQITGTTADHVGDLGGSAAQIGAVTPIGGAQYILGDNYQGICIGPGGGPIIGIFAGDNHTLMGNTGPDPK